MSRLSEEEIQAIMEKYKDAPMVNPDKIYPPLPPVQNVAPLVRIPEPMSRENRRNGIYRQRPFPKRRAGFACNAYGYFSAQRTGIWIL